MIFNSWEVIRLQIQAARLSFGPYLSFWFMQIDSFPQRFGIFPWSGQEFSRLALTKSIVAAGQANCIEAAIVSVSLSKRPKQSENEVTS